jgi:cytochrome c-type biogenesis protein CcmH
LRVLVHAVLALPTTLVVAQVAEQGADPRARALEGRLLAPCCWNQTLDIHDSELSRELHREITARLQGAESVEAIERDLVVRYGERIRAVPPSSPLSTVALATFLAIFLALIGLLRIARRWRDRAATAAVGGDACAQDAAPQDVYEAQITRELAER